MFELYEANGVTVDIQTALGHEFAIKIALGFRL
jgi:hypothetical protein